MKEQQRKDGVSLSRRGKNGLGARANIPINPLRDTGSKPITEREIRSLKKEVEEDKNPVRDGYPERKKDGVTGRVTVAEDTNITCEEEDRVLSITSDQCQPLEDFIKEMMEEQNKPESTA